MATDTLIHKLSTTHPDAILKLFEIPDGKEMYCIQKKFTGRRRVVIIFLEPSHYHAATQLSHHFDGSSDLAFHPTVIILNQKELAELERLNDVRLVPLYPLCKISSDQIKVAAPQWAKQIRTAVEFPEDARQNLLALLGALSFIALKI